MQQSVYFGRTVSTTTDYTLYRDFNHMTANKWTNHAL